MATTCNTPGMLAMQSSTRCNLFVRWRMFQCIVFRSFLSGFKMVPSCLCCTCTSLDSDVGLIVSNMMLIWRELWSNRSNVADVFDANNFRSLSIFCENLTVVRPNKFKIRSGSKWACVVQQCLIFFGKLLHYQKWIFRFLRDSDFRWIDRFFWTSDLQEWSFLIDRTKLDLNRFRQ